MADVDGLVDALAHGLIIAQSECLAKGPVLG
jgi:hypothetical protein